MVAKNAAGIDNVRRAKCIEDEDEINHVTI